MVMKTSTALHPFLEKKTSSKKIPKFAKRVQLTIKPCQQLCDVWLLNKPTSMKSTLKLPENAGHVLLSDLTSKTSSFKSLSLEASSWTSAVETASICTSMPESTRSVLKDVPTGLIGQTKKRSLKDVTQECLHSETIF